MSLPPLPLRLDPDAFSLEGADREAGTATLSGPAGRVPVDAVTLEGAALAADGSALVFLTHDSAFEEALLVLLVGPDGREEDRATLGMPGATGWFRDLVLAPGGAAALFRFAGEGPWRAEVLARPAWRLPLPFGPTGVWRPARLRSRLVLRPDGG